MSASTIATSRHSPRNSGGVADGVSWDAYEAMGNGINDRPIRVNDDRGALNRVSPSTEYELVKEGLATVLKSQALGLDRTIRGGGLLALKELSGRSELGPDAYFRIASEPRLRHKLAWAPATGPPPDPIIEVERSRTVFNGLAIPAARGRSVVWRLHGEAMQVLILQQAGTYAGSTVGRSFPEVPVARLVDFSARIADHGETSDLDPGRITRLRNDQDEGPCS